MARQERTAARTRKAAEQADTIIAEATQRARHETDLARIKVAKALLKRCPVCKETGTAADLKAGGHGRQCTADASAPQTDAKPRTKATAGARVVRKPEAASDPQGAKCVEMRANGSSWMAIGAALGLPGAKNGAAAARKLYAATTGQSHRTAPGLQRKVKERHAATVGSKTARREVVQTRGGFFSTDTPDEEIVALVHGKTVEWSIDIQRLAAGKGEPQWADQEARVHPTDVYVKDVNGERCLNFRTLEGWYEPDPKTGISAPIAGPTRTVRLAAIHTVR